LDKTEFCCNGEFWSLAYMKDEAVFVDWLRAWHGGKDDLRDFWTGIALVCWCLWRHRNDIVFEGASPSSGDVLRKILMEAEV
jgi:hypothetical protein